MQILLPPSETKRAGGTGAYASGDLAFAELLGASRTRVRDALEALSADEDAAARVLKLGVRNREEASRNLALDTSGAIPAIERYTGVLYDALDVGALTEGSRQWAAGHVWVQSALFGLVSASDPIPVYRLSASSRLPDLEGSLKREWSGAHSGIDWDSWHGGELVLDLRSKDYAALAEVPGAVFLHVAQRGPKGEVKALNHFNKVAKGRLVRLLAESQGSLGAAPIVTVPELVEWARSKNIEMIDTDPLTLIV